MPEQVVGSNVQRLEREGRVVQYLNLRTRSQLIRGGLAVQTDAAAVALARKDEQRKRG
jgi:hypothetical protein